MCRDIQSVFERSDDLGSVSMFTVPLEHTSSEVFQDLQLFLVFFCFNIAAIVIQPFRSLDYHYV